MRRLVVLASSLVLVDTLLYAALTPLLPRFTDELALSKALAGVLVAAYALGALVGGLPGGWAAAHFGPRRAVLAGLLLFSTAGFVFAFAHSFAPLAVARLVQGCGSALTWAGAFSWLLASAPRERRGELVGTAMGAAVFGALLGPALGAAAAVAGRGLVFSLVAGLGLAMAGVALRQPDAAVRERSAAAAFARSFRNRAFLGGLGSMCLPALLFGVLGVLAPLHLAAAGWSAAAIGAVWVVGAAFETVQAPLAGRLSDRRGRLLPVRLGLAGGVAVSLALAWVARPLGYVPLVVAASMAYGILFTPSLALMADAADVTGLPQGLAFGLMNAAWAIGAVLGPAGGGALAEATGDRVPLVVSAALCALGLAVARPARDSEHERAAVLVDRLAGDAAGVGRE